MPRRFASSSVLDRFRREIERLFEEAADLVRESPPDRWEPRLDVVELADAIQIWLEVPGLKKERLTVEVSGNEVVFRGNRKPTPTPSSSSRASAPHFLCVERQHGTFERRVKLFWPVNGHQGRAWLTDGVLIVDLPKIQERRRQTRRLEIASEPPSDE